MESRIILEQNGLTTISEYFPNFNNLKRSENNGSKNNPSQQSLDNIETAVQNQFTIYPNPTKGLVNVYATADNLYLQIISMEGKIVKSRKIGIGINLVEIEGLSTGLYQIRLTDSNGELKYEQKLSVL